MTKKTNNLVRFGVAAGVLLATVGGGIAAAQVGVLQIGAGEMSIVMGRGEEGLKIQIAERSCPPKCGIDLAWKPIRQSKAKFLRLL